jgi:hypothetical protein
VRNGKPKKKRPSAKNRSSRPAQDQTGAVACTLAGEDSDGAVPDG